MTKAERNQTASRGKMNQTKDRNSNAAQRSVDDEMDRPLSHDRERERNQLAEKIERINAAFLGKPAHCTDRRCRRARACVGRYCISVVHETRPAQRRRRRVRSSPASTLTTPAHSP